MDTSRFKRREIQTRRSQINRLSEVSATVQRVGSPYPQNSVPTAVNPIVNGEIAVAQAIPIHPSDRVSTDVFQVFTQAPQSKNDTDNTQQADLLNAPSAQEATWQNSIPIDMNLPGEQSPAKKKRTLVTTGKLMTGRRLALRGLVLLLIVILGAGGLILSQGYLKLHKTFRGGAATAAALKVNVNPDLLKGEGDGRINVLLLGRGGGTHDGPDLTDTMLLASIDPVNNTATLLSIPRDLWVDIPSKGAMKINAAWETGEFSYLGSEISWKYQP